MLILWCCLLLTHFLCVHPLNCNKDTEYDWSPVSFCCKKCEPGQYLGKRCSQSHQTECKKCGDDYFMDDYNVELICTKCTHCDKENMEYQRNCTRKNNAICTCKTGYKCNSQKQCDTCVEDPAAKTTPTTTPTPTTPPTLPTTKQRTTPTTNSKAKASITPHKDSVWISLSLCCACVCILLTCFILISRHTPACGWPLSTSTDFWTSKKSSVESSQCTEEEEVPMPVQEVCGGKTEWQEEV